MDTIRRQHAAFVFGSIALCASLYLAATSAPEIWLRSKPVLATFAQFLGAVGVSWTVVPALAIGLYELGGWKLVNAHLNYSGSWRGTEKQYRYDESGKPVFDYDAWCDMRIKQDVRHISIVEGHTHPGDRSEKKQAQTYWSSTSCELDANDGEITASLGVSTTPIRAGGHIEQAIEEFRVTKRGFMGRPIEMASQVQMTAGTPAPRFVTISYVRG